MSVILLNSKDIACTSENNINFYHLEDGFNILLFH